MNSPNPKPYKLFIMTRFLTGLVFLLFSLSIQAAWFDFLPYTVSQPDGTVIECYASGDEFFNWLHDENGFTIIAGSDGFYYYGKELNGLVVPTSYRVNTIDPESVGLEPWAKISREEYLKIREEFWKDADKSVKAPHTGTLNNLVVYIRFADQTEFTQPRSLYNARFNSTTSASLKHYFYEVSYEKLTIESHHYPICELTTNLSYQDQHPRSYYEPYHAVNNPNGYQGDTQRRIREHTLLVNAINFIAPEVPANLIIDADNDGYVDNVCFIIRGNSGAWADLLWAHRWVLYTYSVYIHGKRVYDYTFQPENQNNVQTLCHEMFHVLGAPDLYHYSSNGIAPVGPWDLMESGYCHMGAFMKYKYANQKWVTEMPQITTAGTYTLNPLTSPTNNVFKIASPNSSTQYFVVEYRKRTGIYETNLPGDGLLVYRIDPSAGNGNAGGPPDEVYIYRPNGTTTINGNISQAHFSLTVNRTAINDETNPSSFLQNGSPGGLNIFNITAAGETISFDILMGTEVFADFTSNVTTVPTGGSVSFTDLSSNLPNSWNWSFPGGNPSSSTLQNPTITYTQPGIYPVTLVAANNYGNGSITKEDYMIVGTPVIDVNPLSLNISMPVNTKENHQFTIANNGDTWLRYSVDKEYETPENITLVSGGVPGTVIKTYSNLPTSRTGMTWAEGNLYVVTMNGTLNIYDTAQSAVTSTFNIHNQAFSIAYDGDLLWIGSSNGTVKAYNLNGEPTGESFSLPTAEIYTLGWDGNYFIVNLAGQNNPFFYRVNHQGAVMQMLTTDLQSRATQVVWVPEHTGGNLWVNSIGKIVRLKEVNNQFIVLSDFNSPSNLSYALAHDGIDLWWSATGGFLYRIEDGLLEWLFINWNQTLLQAGMSHEIPLVINTKGMDIGIHHATIVIENNDFNNPVVELPLALTVTFPTGVQTPLSENIRIFSINREIWVQLGEETDLIADIYDVTGRLLKTTNKSNVHSMRISNLTHGRFYIVRITTNNGMVAKKIFLN